MNLEEVEEELELTEGVLDYPAGALGLSRTAHLSAEDLSRLADFITAHMPMNPAKVLALRTVTSRGALRLNNVPVEAKPYFRHLMRDPGVMDCDVCTEAARRVMARLGTGAAADRHDDVLKYLRENFNSHPNIQEGLYNLTISIGDGQGWQHGLVLMKQGNGLYLIQGWVGRFTVGEWLNPANPAGLQPALFEHYSPAGARFRVENMQQWLDMLAQLSMCFTTGPGPFEAACTSLFGIEWVQRDRTMLRMAKGSSNPLNLAWKFQPLDPR